MKKRYLIITIILIFIISIAVSYWPVFHKGYAYDFGVDNLILARNLSLTGEYKIDNEKNVVLSSEIVQDKGIHSKAGNKLTPVLYSKIFDIFGFNQEIPLYTCLILFALINVLLFLLINRLFNFWIALIFSGISIFMPIVSAMAIRSGFYEWAVLFFSIALLFYLYKEKPGCLSLVWAGLFFGLASLSLNAFGLSFIPFLIYDFWKNRSIKRLAVFALPFFLLWGLYLGPSLIERGVADSVYLSSRETETTTDYMHVFPDPYTWHFERDAYVESIKGTSNYNSNEFLIKYGYPVSLENRFLMYLASALSYPKGLFAQTIFGGPLLILFLLAGAIYLYKKKTYLMQLILIWGISWYLLLIGFKGNRWGHFIELGFPLILLISLGIYWLIRFIWKQDTKIKFKYLLCFCFFIFLLLHLVQADKWTFHEWYENSVMGQALVLVDLVEENKQDLDKERDIIAVGLENPTTSVVNWYTDFSCVYFNPNTVKKLLKENKLQRAFDQFGVTRVVGYDKELAGEIVRAAEVKIITNSQ